MGGGESPGDHNINFDVFGSKTFALGVYRMPTQNLTRNKERRFPPPHLFHFSI